MKCKILYKKIYLFLSLFMLKKSPTLTLKEYLYHKDIITQQTLYYEPKPDKQNKIVKWMEDVIFPLLQKNDIQGFQELSKEIMKYEVAKEMLNKRRVKKEKVIVK